MKQATKSKQKIKNKGQVQEEFQVIYPTHQTVDTTNGVSSYSQVKTIRYQSSGPTKMPNQRDRKNQEYLFHIGNHARTVSEIIRFRYEQYQQQQQAQSNHNLTQHNSQQKQVQQQQQKPSQIHESNSTALIMQYQKNQQNQMLNSSKRSATVSNLKSQGQSQAQAGIQFTKDIQSLNQSKGQQPESYNQPAQSYIQKGIPASLMGSPESKISSIKQVHNDEFATAGDTRDNFFTATQSSQKTNPLNFTFQDHPSQQKKNLQSIQRNLFDSIESNKINPPQHTLISPDSKEKEYPEIDQVKKSKFEQKLNQEQDRLLQAQEPSVPNPQFQQQSAGQPSFYLSFKPTANPVNNYNSEVNNFAKSELGQAAGPTNFSLNLISDNYKSNTSIQQGSVAENKKSRDTINSQLENYKSNLPSATFSISAIKANAQQSLQQQSEQCQTPQLQVQDKSNTPKPTIENLSKFNSSSTLETNQLGLGNKVTEPKFVNNFQSNSNGLSMTDFTSLHQPNYFSQGNTPLLSTERQFKIKLTKITKDSQIQEEYQLSRVPPSFQDIPSENNQDLLIKFIDQKKQDYLNNLQADDNSDFSKTPQTNKSEVIKRFKASQIYDKEQTSSNQTKNSIYGGNGPSKYDFSKRIESINNQNEQQQSSLISSAQKTQLSHQMPTSMLPGMGRINNFVRKSQEMAQQNNQFNNYQLQKDSPLLNSKINSDKQSSSSAIPTYHLPENYSSLQQQKNSNSSLPYQFSQPNFLSQNQQIYSQSNEGNTTTYKQDNQTSGHVRQYSFQQDTKSSLSLIKNILEGSQEQQAVSASGFFTKEQAMKSPKSSQLEDILSKYKSIKEQDNLRESTKFYSQVPQTETRSSFSKLLSQPNNYSGSALFNVQLEQTQNNPIRNSLTVLENDKIKKIMSDIQAKIELRNSQSLDQSQVNSMSNPRLSQFQEKNNYNPLIQDYKQNTQNGPVVSFANNSNIAQSTIESSTNLQQKIYNQNSIPYSNHTLFTETNDQKPYQNKLEHTTSIIRQSIYSNMLQSQQAGSRKEIDQPISQNNFNLTFEDINPINKETEKSQSQLQSERKITQVDISSDKSNIKEEQDKTYDSENRDEMNFNQKSSNEKKIETMSNAHDMSQFLCQTPMQQNGQHIRLMSGNMENLTLNNSIQSLPQDQIINSSTTMPHTHPNQSNNNSLLTTQNNLQSHTRNPSYFQNAKPQNNQLKNSQEILQDPQHTDANLINNSAILKKSTEIKPTSEQKIEMKDSQEIRKSQFWDVNTPKKQQENQQNNSASENNQEIINTPQTIVSVPINDNQNDQLQQDEDYAIEYDTAFKQGEGRREADLNNRLSDEQTVSSVFQSPLACITCKNEDEEKQGYFPSAKQFYNNQKDQEEGEENQQGFRQSQDEFNFQTQDTLRTSSKNPNHVRFNNSNNQLYNILSSHKSNLGFYKYDAINIDGKTYQDDYQQTDSNQFKSVSVQTNEQGQSKRNSIFDECTKLFSPKMKFIEPDFRENQCMMLNISNQSSQIDQRDNKDDQDHANEMLRDSQYKPLKKSDLFKQKPAQQQQHTSSNGNYETGYINSSIQNSQKEPSDNEEAYVKQQQIYNQIFEVDELPVVEQKDQPRFFKGFQPIDADNMNNNAANGPKNRTYSSQYSDKEKKNIQKQIDDLVNKKGQKNINKQLLKNQLTNVKPKEPSVNQKSNKQQLQSSISPMKKHISFNNKVETRKVAANKDQKNDKKQGNQTERVFERLYPQQLNKQQKPVVLHEVHQEKSKSKSKGRSISGNKSNGEMDFIKINKQNVPYMMRKKVDDRYQLFKKAVEVNLENMIQDQKSHQIKSIILEDDNMDQDNLQEIFQKSLVNRTQKNLVSYDTMTMINKLRYNPSYNP